MLGKSKITIFTLLILILSGCNRFNYSNSDRNIDNSYHISKIKEENADKLLRDSDYIEYPNNINFTPKHLTDSGLVISEISEYNKEEVSYLGYIDLFDKNKNINKIKDIEKTSNIVSFIVHSSNKEYLFFEEFDQINKTATYYLYNFNLKKSNKIHIINNVTPIHYTQVSWYNDIIIFNCYDSKSENYLTYKYDFNENNTNILVENNNSNPIIYDNNLFYVSIDNTNLETSIIKKDILNNNIKVLENIKNDKKYIESIHYNNQNEFLKVINDNGIKKIYKTDYSFNKGEVLYSSSWIETVVYKNNFVTFLGNPRNDKRVRGEYYLLDVKNNIDYVYNDSVIYLSNKGILWVQFKEDEDKIPKGKTFTNNNSVMRFFSFDRRK